MPDLVSIIVKRWKLMVTITVLATIIALIAALLSPKKFLSVATALPANSLIADKGRIFNQNIQELYSDFGTTDELDKLEGTGNLDTIFIAASEKFNLDQHYRISSSGESFYSAALKLKANCKIARSSYGELKVKVWDEDKNLAAEIANFLMREIQNIHQHLQNENSGSALEKIKEDYKAKQNEYLQLTDSATAIAKTRLKALSDQLEEEQKMINQYQLAINTNAPVLLIVENARPSFWPDKPKILATVLFAFFGALLFSFLLSLFIESRKP